MSSSFESVLGMHEFSIACMSSNHALCEWCAGCWCHDDDNGDPDFDELGASMIDYGGEGW
jgi:hypothetical protein